MTTMNRNQLRPPYPVFRENGIAPKLYTPPDLRPSGLGPGYSWYGSAHGRYLAGLGASDMEEKSFDAVNSEGIETYPNELDALAVADDTWGNGVFDPNDTHGNIHPDAGVFQDHQSLPGYVHRDHFYELSEVRDLTYPGGRVVYVPGGAVSLQQGQQETLTKTAEFWKLPPGMNPITPEGIPSQSIVDAPTASKSIGQADSGTSTDYTPYYIAAGVGLAIGVAYLALRK